MTFTESSVAEQSGKTFVITGGNSGIGYEAALVLAKKNAHVILACRSPQRAGDALASIRSAVPNANVEAMRLDLASLKSVRTFAEELLAKQKKLDGLVNNAGLMALPYTKTEDGFEMQLGTNHLGHFALTGLVLPLLLKTPGARVVNVASQAHRMGKIHFDDLHGERWYERWTWYGQSKLANLLFTNELARRLQQKNANVLVTAAHPGYSSTALQTKGAEMENAKFSASIFTLGNRLFAQTATMGAMPTLRALADRGASTGDYFGPNGIGELAGPPVRVGMSKRAKNEADAKRLWELSEKLTGVSFPL
jgi:NAD(P)-dependent dehydrogenase (short-subunit alcohol dehydrogenase family)